MEHLALGDSVFDALGVVAGTTISLIVGLIVFESFLVLIETVRT